MNLRRSNDRGFADHGWLRSFHTFSFADYHDPRHMRFFALRVINEDRVHPGGGFPTHGHRDMEIVSYVLDGALEHKDSMGNGSIIRPGDVQRMSAGTGVRHSEYNASGADDVHFLQIWIVPDRPGHAPGYEQRHFDRAARRGALRLVASPNGADESVTIHQNTSIYAGLFDGDEGADHALPPGRAAWVHVARGTIDLTHTHPSGTVEVNRLNAGDAAAIGGGALRLDRGVGAEVLVFDLDATR